MTPVFSYIEFLFLILSVSVGFCSSLYAELKVTNIVKSNNSLDIVLNSDIKLLNVLLKSSDVELPVYKNKDKVYKQFAILKREFRHYLVAALSENRLSSKTENTTFKINKFSILKKHPTIKAFASVIFNHDIEVECRVMQGTNGLWIAWPSTKKNGVWIKDFEFVNKSLKETVEKKLISEYASVINYDKSKGR
jgi:DNA-binding cell septation regulator SpoVG